LAWPCRAIRTAISIGCARVLDKAIQVHPIHIPRRVPLKPPAECWGVVPEADGVESGFAVEEVAAVADGVAGAGGVDGGVADLVAGGVEGVGVVELGGDDVEVGLVDDAAAA
jgi:hypothetical protein